MCGFCTAAALDDFCGKDEIGSLSADLDQVTIPGDTSAIAVGDVAYDTLQSAGDTDWFQLDLSDTETVRLSLFGVDHDTGNGLGALEDPLVRIYDSNGTLLAENDDVVSGLLRGSSLVMTGLEPGTYYIEVDAYASGYAGDYALAVTPAIPRAPQTPLDAIAGRKALNDSGPILVYFAVDGDSYSYGGDTYTASGTNAYEQGQLFSVFDGVETFADIDFEITTDRALADLEIATAVLPSDSSGTLLGFFLFPTVAGDGQFGVLNNNPDALPYWNTEPGGTLDDGGFMYGVAIHEFGHAMGLGHPHDTGNGSSVMQGVDDALDRGDYELNSAVYTAMSYNEGSTIAGIGSSTASTGHGGSYAALDIAVLQEFYGANTTYAAGDDTYALWDSNDTGSGAGYYTAWDTGGLDTFEYLGLKNAVMDLRAATLLYEDGGGGFISYVEGVIGGRTIANGVVIENATTGSGNDSLTGNDVANVLDAGDGDDFLFGLAGDDTMRGQDGADRMNGGTGDDLMLGNGGTDLLFGGDGGDRLRGGSDGDELHGGNGRDWLDYRYSSAGVTVDLTAGTATGGDAEGDVFSKVEFIDGTNFDDVLTGQIGVTRLRGGAGNDTLNGMTGDDILEGGDGDDTFVCFLGDGNDSYDGGAGTDTADYSTLLSSAFSIIGAGGDWTLTHLGNGEIDVLTSVEVLLFSDTMLG